jgi:hypothetical protein
MLIVTLCAACAEGGDADPTDTDTDVADTTEDTQDTEDTEVVGNDDLTDDVAALVIRRLKPGQDAAAFEAARDAYVALLEAESGVVADREFEAIVDFSTFAAPDPAVWIGLTQGRDLAGFGAAADVAGATPEAAAFFETFDLVTFAPLAPLEDGTAVDIAAMISGDEILEVAVRDLSTYDDFDAAAYEAARDAFLPMLGAMDGVLGEYQWVSAADPNLVVGMTVYADQDTYFAVASDPTLTSSQAYADFVFGYPFQAGFAATVHK